MRDHLRIVLRMWSHAVRNRDGGNAIVEFTFVGLIALVPLVYLIASVASVQRSSQSVTEAARAAGRAFATAPDLGTGGSRAEVAVRLVFADHGLDPASAEIRIVAVASPCDGPLVVPSLAAGAEFAVCVRRQAELPGVPTMLVGRGVTTVGRYSVHIDDFRAS